MINVALIVALVSYYTVMFITPGPNNAMLTISGIKFGFRRSIPHISGIAIGHAIQVSLVCVFLGYFLKEFPKFQLILKWLCFIYLLYLAYRMIGSIKDHQKDTGRPLRFYEASLFQWINPKAWTIAMTVGSGFMPIEEKLWVAVLFTGLMSSIVSFPCISLWALFGTMIKKFVSNAKIKKIIEITFAVLLVLTGLYLIF
ncbi:MAG: LysE family translocator [Pelagibacteraceae bacterium]